MIAFLKRLFNLPLLLKMHVDHSILTVDFQNAQNELYAVCEDGSPQYVIDRKAKNLEVIAEKLSDLDARFDKILGGQK